MSQKSESQQFVDDALASLKRMLKKKWVKRGIFLFATLLLIFTVVWVMREMYLYGHPHQRIDFQSYVPKELPRGIKIVDKDLEVWDEGIFSDFLAIGSQLLVRISLGENGQIANSKYLPEARNGDLPGKCGWIYEGAQDTECENLKTPQGQRYFVATIYNDGKKKPATSQEVGLVRSGTSIFMRITLNNGAISSKDWDRVIDSLQPIETRALPIRHYTPGP